MTKIIIIGAGPGGYEAAIRAAQLDAEVVLIEKDAAGGTCLNRGCIPTKTLWKIADIYKDLEERSIFGIEAENIGLDGLKIRERKDDVVNTVVSGVDFVLGTYPNIERIKGTGTFKDKNTVVVETEEGQKEVTGDVVLIATGSQVAFPPFDGVDLDNVLTSDTILELETVPKSMVVIGAGVIGMEFASIYAKFGTKVTVMGGELLPASDNEVAKRLKSVLAKDGIKFELNVRAEKIEKTDEGLKVTAGKKGKDAKIEATAEYVLIATGRKANIDALNLEAVGVETERSAIVADDEGHTNVDNIYAIGDCVYGNVQLAHWATAQGTNCVERIMGSEATTVMDVLPSAVFTLPECAQVGKTEQELKAEGIDFVKSKYMYTGNGKAVSLGETDGFVKILASPDLKEILGVHILGPHANDAIHLGAMAITNKLSVEDTSKMIYAHPTLSEVFMEAVHLLEGHSINSPKAR